MKHLKYNTIFRMLWCACVLLTPKIVHGETPAEDLKQTMTPGTINIKSSTLEVDNKLKLITFSGDVKVTKDNFVIYCDKLVGYGLDAADDKKKEKDTDLARFDKIIATGNVVIHRAEGGNATSNEAIYYLDREEIVLTGNPVVKSENDIVKGEKIIIFLKEDRVLVNDPIGTFAPRQ